MKDKKYTVGLGPFGSCADRFCPGGYRANPSIEERFEMVKRVKGIDGLELHSHMFDDKRPVEYYEKILKGNGWICSLVSCNVWGAAKWGQGGFTHPDAALRREAVAECKRTMDYADRLGGGKINLWLGQDGHDYAFQTDYRQTWNWLVEGVAECAAHNPKVKICLEPKLKEPRVRIAVGTAGKALYLKKCVGMDNVGVNLDVGHCIQAFETPAETAVLLARENALFHLHFNDNYGDWDWDLTTGSVFFWELLELCFWLEELEWDNICSFDIFPSKEDPVDMVQANVDNLKGAWKLVAKLPREELLEAMKTRQFRFSNRILREVVYGGD
ncbi:MAG TPA: sugar phosphate isomerase/epimerase family protein [Candidatus Brocadiia bacterium]|nr:sugar phosphate isomerase/epimerase family protein [Candidatus Brocadiia bacterium]